MKRICALLAVCAVLQLAIPAQAASPVMVAICGGGAPIELPTKNKDQGQPCCKICHSAMRKRFGGDTCCSKDGGEDPNEEGE